MMTHLPTSPEDMALIPVRTAWDSAWARGDPPPHGITSNRLLASEMERVGGRSTCISISVYQCISVSVYQCISVPGYQLKDL